MSQPPIIPQDYIFGPKVVEIGDLRVARGLTRRPHQSCKHMSMTYDQQERRIWCNDCETEVDPFDAFRSVCESWHYAVEKLRAREEKVKQAEAFAIRSLAAREMDKAWRARSTVPLCPHCKSAILPEDVSRGVACSGRELEIARRAAIKGGG